MSKNKSENLLSALPGFHLTNLNYHTLHPIGLYMIKGQYHLFSKVHGLLANDHTIIQHSTSQDLIQWNNLEPIQIVPENAQASTFVFDTKNVSALGVGSKAPLLLFYTMTSGTSQVFCQFSLDGGIKWNAVQKNAILDLKRAGGKAPFVFYHEASGKWIMLITLPGEFKVLFYSSKNLVKWELVNDFGGHPSFKERWEVASLCPATVVNVQGKIKWILMVTTKGEFSASRYFIGEFDGKSFLCDHALDSMLKVDNGKDFYGVQPGHGVFPKRNLLIAAAENTHYDEQMPSKGWKGFLTSPREFYLNKEADGSFKLSQQFAPELQALRIKHYTFPKSAITTELEWDFELSSYMEFNLKLDSNKGCNLEFDFGNKTKLILTWDVIKHQILLDRTAKTFAFHPDFNSLETANISPGHVLDLHIILDKYSIEIIADRGKVALTSIFFAMNDLQRFRIIGKQFAASGDIWILKSV